MFWTILGNVLFIFAMRLIDVSLGTIRMIMINRGQKLIAPLLGFVEVTIWVVAVSRVFSNLDSIWHILAYSGGFAAGTLVGMLIEERMALGEIEIQAISTQKSGEIAEKLRAADFGVTTIKAAGRSGALDVVTTVAQRKEEADILKIIEAIDPNSFVTVEAKKEVQHGYLHTRK